MLDKIDFLIYNTKLHYNPLEGPWSGKPSICTIKFEKVCKNYILTDYFEQNAPICKSDFAKRDGATYP